MSENKWVVLVSETDEDGEVTCQVVSEEYAERSEADDFACDLAFNNNKSWRVEVCTPAEAVEVVTE